MLYGLRGNSHIFQYYEISTFRSFFDQNFCNPKPLTQLNPDPGQRIIYKSVFWIHEVFVRRRIGESIPLTLMDPDPDPYPDPDSDLDTDLDPDLDPDPAIFVSDLQVVYTKLSFSKFFLLITF
jgi:hypothetical protein